MIWSTSIGDSIEFEIYKFKVTLKVLYAAHSSPSFEGSGVE